MEDAYNTDSAFPESCRFGSGEEQVKFFMAVRYDSEGFAGVVFHDTLQECLDSALEDGCIFASIGEHPKSVRTRHFARHEDGWHELESGEELDRLRGLDEPPRMFWRVA